MRDIKIILKGLKFGMLLQLAIGPVCLFIFQIATLKGFYIGEIGVFGVTLVDGLFITAAILGIASIIDRKDLRFCLKIFGTTILLIFGLSTILNQFDIVFLPSLSIGHNSNFNNVFTSAIILTASNPLTIIFWAGIFSVKVAEESIRRQDIYFFGLGALLSTIIFLTLIAFIGSFTSMLFPANVIKILNIIIGFLLMYFGIRMIGK